MFSKSEYKKDMTCVSQDAHLKGTLQSEGDILIKGVVKGQVKTKGIVYIAKEGKITSGVEGRTIEISGNVKGTVKAHRLEVLAGGEVIGDIETEVLLVEEGGMIDGQCKMMKKNKIITEEGAEAVGFLGGVEQAMHEVVVSTK